MVHWIPVLLLSGLLLTACDGVREGESSAAAWTAQTVWRLEEDLRLGRVNGGGPDQFGLIGSLLVDGTGRIHVLDILSQEIRVFHADGHFSHVVGGQGDGPGEFRDVYGMAVDAGDTLWVLDRGAGRYTAFDPDGSLLGTWPRRLAGYGYRPGAFLPDGRHLDWGTERLAEDAALDTPRVRLHPVAFSQRFGVRDSLPPLEYRTRTTVVDGRRLSAAFFLPVARYALDSSGDLWFATEYEYRLYHRRLSGDTTRVVVMEDAPAPINEADRDYVRRRMAYRPAWTSAYLAALPAVRPVVHEILSDGAGHIFVIADVAGAVRGTVLDVFEDEGRYLGRLDLPEPLPLLPPQPLVAFATKDHLLVVLLDENDAPVVSRLRIVRP